MYVIIFVIPPNILSNYRTIESLFLVNSTRPALSSQVHERIIIYWDRLCTFITFLSSVNAKISPVKTMNNVCCLIRGHFFQWAIYLRRLEEFLIPKK